MPAVWNPALPTTIDNHPTYDESPDPQALPCVCWYAGREGREPWQGMPHPEKYGQGAQAAFEYDNDI